jgi:CBS domain-containing protein
MTAARDIMTVEVLTVPPEMPLTQLATLLDDHDISGAPVTDRDGRVVGVVSATDLVRRARLPNPAGTVADIMTRGTVSVRPATTVPDLARFLVRSRLHRALVMEEGRLLGIVTAHDALAAMADMVTTASAAMGGRSVVPGQ